MGYIFFPECGRCFPPAIHYLVLHSLLSLVALYFYVLYAMFALFVSIKNRITIWQDYNYKLLFHFLSFTIHFLLLLRMLSLLQATLYHRLLVFFLFLRCQLSRRQRLLLLQEQLSVLKEMQTSLSALRMRKRDHAYNHTHKLGNAGVWLEGGMSTVRRKYLNIPNGSKHGKQIAKGLGGRGGR